MNRQLVNEAFNEALEEAGGDTGEVFSMEFVTHHEAALELQITRLRQQNHVQNFAFITILIVLVLGVKQGWIKPGFLTAGNTSVIMICCMWFLIGLNSMGIAWRNRRMLAIEKQLLLIAVYKKILQKEAVVNG